MNKFMIASCCIGYEHKKLMPESVAFELHQSKCPHNGEKGVLENLDHCICLCLGKHPHRCPNVVTIECMDVDKNKYVCECK